MDKQILDEYKDIFLQDYIQNYTGLFFHPEAGVEEDNELNYKLYDIYKDLIKIDDALINTGVAINNLMTNTTLRLDQVKESIMSEKERCQDIQMLCNKYTDFDNVNTIDSLIFEGSHSKEGDVIFAPVKKTRKVALQITSIDGNGYEGNGYVYNNFEYQKDIYDTSLRENMTDNKISTYYEYSRITVQNDLEETNTYFNKDTAKARCTMTLSSEEFMNYLDISTEDVGVIITNIQYSLDGIKYFDTNIPNKISLNNKLDSYDNYGYVYGSGLLAVPLCKFIKITFETDRNKDDVIAYEKAIITGEKASIDVIRDKYSGVVVDHRFTVQPNTETSTYVVKGAKRSAIKINNISAYKNDYLDKMQIMSNELLTTDCFSISLFANVYVPANLNDDSVQFILILNGYTYEVVPINSNLNGTKVIRFSGGKSNKKYTQLISEKIKSAKLAIVFKGKADSTPFINNIKILIGGEI